MAVTGLDIDLLVRKYKESDEDGRLPHHWLAAKAQTHSHALASVGVQSICRNLQALITRDNKGETPIDIASRSGACAEIIGLLSLTPEEARSLGSKEMYCLYAPVAYWMGEMALWIKSRSYADCHKFINEHDDELAPPIQCVQRDPKRPPVHPQVPFIHPLPHPPPQIGRASCRERV